MPLINANKDSQATGTALAYITIGAILTILAGTTFFFFTDRFSSGGFLGYLRWAVLLIGVVLLVIGVGIGQISRAARPKPTHEEIQEEAIKHGQAPPPPPRS